MYIPLWAAIAGGLLTMTGTIVAGWFLFRGKIAELTVNEDASIRDDQRELIDTLRANTTSYQDLLVKYADSILQGAETRTELAVIKSEVVKLRADFQEMKADRDNIQADRERLLQQAACVPLLEEQIKDRDKSIKGHLLAIRQQTAQIAELHDKLDTANVLLDAATRGQERAEGAVSMSAVMEKVGGEKVGTERTEGKT